MAAMRVAYGGTAVEEQTEAARRRAATPKEIRHAVLRGVGLWTAAALPMGVLGWIVAPALSPALEVDPVGAVVARFGALTLGLV